MYLLMKHIFEKQKRRVGPGSYPSVTELMQADLNANLQSIVFKMIVARYITRLGILAVIL